MYIKMGDTQYPCVGYHYTDGAPQARFTLADSAPEEISGMIELYADDGAAPMAAQDADVWPYKWADGNDIILSQTEKPAAPEPGPDPEPGPQPEPEAGIEERIAALEAGKADKADIQALYDDLANAYQEGVKEA